MKKVIIIVILLVILIVSAVAYFYLNPNTNQNSSEGPSSNETQSSEQSSASNIELTEVIVEPASQTTAVVSAKVTNKETATKSVAVNFIVFDGSDIVFNKTVTYDGLSPGASRRLSLNLDRVYSKSLSVDAKVIGSF